VVLSVSVDDFAEAIKRHDTSSMRPVAYRHATRLHGAGQILHLTYANPSQNLLVIAEMLIGGPDDLEAIEGDLRSKGVTLETGAWLPTVPTQAAQARPPAEGGEAPPEFWIGCVAYQSDEDEPGLWVDAFTEEPSEEDVLRAMFDEFVSSGDLGDATFEDFTREATPTVQIADARDVRNWLRQKS
jgi:hypothetical protein